MVHALKLMDPAAFADLARELPLKAFLRRQWRDGTQYPVTLNPDGFRLG